MEKTLVKNDAPDKKSSEEFNKLLASHLEAQPESIQSFHRFMGVLESISFGIIIMIFITAFVLSFLWKSIPVVVIPGTWLLLPVGAALTILLIAVHTLVLKAFPPSNLFTIFQRGSPIRLPGKPRGFLTGKAAVNQGIGLLLIGLIMGAFFAIFDWAIWTSNWTLLTPMIQVLGVLLGIIIAASIVVSMISKTYQKLSKSD
jgi:hypothetical protein